MILPGNPPGRPPPPPFRTWDTKHSISLFFLPHPAVLMLLNRRLIETLATQAMSNAAEDIVKNNFAPALILGTVSPRTYKCLSVYEFTLHRTTSGFHEETEKHLFREPRLHLTSNNSVKNTIITAVSCLVESLTVFWQKYLCGFLTSRKHDIYEQDAFFIATSSKSEMQISTGHSATLCLEPWLGDRSIHIFVNRCIAIGRIIFLDHWVRSAAKYCKSSWYHDTGQEN